MATSSKNSSFCGKVYSGTSKRHQAIPRVEAGYSWVRLKKCDCDPSKFYDVRVSGSVTNLGRIYYKCISCQAFEWGNSYDLKENLHEATLADAQGPAADTMNMEELRELKSTVLGLCDKVDGLVRVAELMKYIVMFLLLLLVVAFIKP
jgi:hypothetical protein